MFDRPHLVVERLVRPVAPLVELQDRVHARHALVEGHRVQLADDREDVLCRTLERRAHRVHPVAHPILLREPPLDLRDVLAGTYLRASEGEHGEVGGGHRHAGYGSRIVTTARRTSLRSTVSVIVAAIFTRSFPRAFSRAAPARVRCARRPWPRATTVPCGPRSARVTRRTVQNAKSKQLTRNAKACAFTTRGRTWNVSGQPLRSRGPVGASFGTTLIRAAEHPYDHHARRVPSKSNVRWPTSPSALRATRCTCPARSDAPISPKSRVVPSPRKNPILSFTNAISYVPDAASGTRCNFGDAIDAHATRITDVSRALLSVTYASASVPSSWMSNEWTPPSVALAEMR